MDQRGGLGVLLCGAAADTLSSALATAGFRVSVTNDCAQALRELIDQGPWIVIFDADHAAASFLSDVTRVSAHVGALAVVIGKSPAPEQIVAAVRAGAVDYLVKDPEGGYLATLPERLRHIPLAAASYSADDIARRFHQMARELSHDVRNPIGNVLGFVELLTENPGTKLGQEQQQFLNRIKANCTLVLDLLKQFTTETRRFADPQ